MKKLKETMEYYSEFKNCFGLADAIFYKLKKFTHFYGDKMNRFAFVPPRDNEKPAVMFVCHLDTVQTAVINDEDSFCYYGAGFDDRTGLHLCARLYLDKYHKENICFLFCDNEEIGQSTGQNAVSVLDDYEISLMVELDRASNDYVTYQYSNALLEQYLEELGITQGMGTYSDISELDFLGVMGINLGVGYTKAHSKKSVQSKLGIEYAFASSKQIIAFSRDTVFEDESMYYKGKSSLYPYDYPKYDWEKYYGSDGYMYDAEVQNMVKK